MQNKSRHRGMQCLIRPPICSQNLNKNNKIPSNNSLNGIGLVKFEGWEIPFGLNGLNKKDLLVSTDLSLVLK